jgi:hypothetical protein
LWQWAKGIRVTESTWPSPKMTVEHESELRVALRHVQTGRRCILRQFGVIATLQSKGLPTEQAKNVLKWLEETQREFEDHYQKVLSEGFAAIERPQAKLRDDR